MTTITITFTSKQFEALKSVLTLFDEQEWDYVREHYELSEENANGNAEILAQLEEAGAGETTWADMQRVWIAINTATTEKAEKEQEIYKAMIVMTEVSTKLIDEVVEAKKEAKKWKDIHDEKKVMMDELIRQNCELRDEINGY
jgi:hypothetical protein